MCQDAGNIKRRTITKLECSGMKSWVLPVWLLLFTGTGPGGVNQTLVFWEGAAQNITSEAKVTLFRGICSSPTCLPVSQWDAPLFLLLSALILPSHSELPCSCPCVLWLAQVHDSTGVCCRISRLPHVTKCSGRLFSPPWIVPHDYISAPCMQNRV